MNDVNINFTCGELFLQAVYNSFLYLVRNCKYLIYFSVNVHGATTNKIVTSSSRELFFLLLFVPLLEDWTACFFATQNKTKQKQKCKIIRKENKLYINNNTELKSMKSNKAKKTVPCYYRTWKSQLLSEVCFDKSVGQLKTF